MKLFGLLALLLVASAFADDSSSSEEENEGLPLAEACDQEACSLPDCRCSSTNIPGGLNPRDVPQFVTVTFDDGVSVNNIITYRDILYNRLNSNGCPAGVTFFVSHEYTNYALINELYNQGFEIALHSISHRTPQTYWFEATKEVIKEEIADQKAQMAHFANIPPSAIKGVRMPFLQLAGNASFEIMAEYGLEYDCTWPTIAHTNPGLWPYTLDYASTQDCIIPPCPSASIPGVWVKPMVAWSDLNGVPCSMVDACFFIPDRENEEEWYKFILSNFERHYLGNRAPFGFYVHEAFLAANPAVNRALVRFMDLVNNLNDAFMVNAHEVVDWVKNPKPLNEYRSQGCRSFSPSTCNPNNCGPLFSTHNQLAYYMQVCSACPSNYPWVGNPLGQ
uniref:Chitin binding PM protein n=1 Tax=Helicoverpa armigera TaxID=29058 RepID=B1NLD6_HELAM|nr:chitin binding PM protein [Helicoverpa armigera]